MNSTWRSKVYFRNEREIYQIQNITPCPSIYRSICLSFSFFRETMRPKRRSYFLARDPISHLLFLADLPYKWIKFAKLEVSEIWRAEWSNIGEILYDMAPIPFSYPLSYELVVRHHLFIIALLSATTRSTFLAPDFPSSSRTKDGI